MRLRTALCSVSCILWSTMSLAANVGGEFSCKITSLQITKIVEGRPTVLNGWEDRDAYKVGDETTLRYYDSDNPYASLIDADLDFKDKTIFKGSYLKKRLPLYEDYVVLKSAFGDEFYFSDNEIHLSTTFREIRLKRYYKSDWGGYLINSAEDYAEIIGLDCRTKKDGYETLLQIPFAD